ncbi:MAG TPA: DUF1549 domain-containing protein, partial [bacterium]|nr:DUF1549 domain-containing protein [bacterium]
MAGFAPRILDLHNGVVRVALSILGLLVVVVRPLGAQQHWAYRPLPREVAVPEVEGASWGRNPIDRFVLARLRAEGLSPAPSADPAAWLRRVTLTLTGLPPTIAELDAFLADSGADARARVVDRLLESPRYGERMASEWLDVARYADTFGYQNDVERPTWPWRDWVVRALNENLPFDQFATWQIAGDLLPNATTEQRLATAFQRLHRQTNEGGSVEEEMRLEYVADRTQTFATAFLGMTMACARCHDHKFDPIRIDEYYALSAFFDNIDECGLYSHFTRATPTPALSLPTPQQTAAERRARQRVERLEREWSALCEQREPDGFDVWRDRNAPGFAGIREPRGAVGAFSFESLAGGRIANAAAAERQGLVGDAPRLVAGRRGKAIAFDGEDWAKFPAIADFDRHQPFSLGFYLRVPRRYDRAVVLHRSKSWTDAGSRGYELLIEDGELSFALIHFWPGNAIRVRTDAPLPVGEWRHVALTYDGSSRAAGLCIYVDGRPAAQRVVRDGLTRTITGGGADALTLAARFRDRGLARGAIDELRVFDRELTRGEIAVLAGVAEALDADALRGYFLRCVSEAGRAKLADLTAARRELGKVRDAQAEIMVMREMADRRATYVRPRGSYLAKGARVEPNTPACLPPLPAGAERNRLTLARWLTAPDHPLTARVAVNRVWQMHFGIGLVATAEDFGTQGEPPSHPHLLDWLARWFVDSGWDLKALHRLIVTSATFAQCSCADAELHRRDPDNRLLARGPRFSLPAEVLRDQALFVGGLLAEKLGGPPVRPYQPAGLWREKSGQVYRPSKGEGLWRRSLYTFWKRTSPPPTMMLLDASKRDVCAMRRQRTAT